MVRQRNERYRANIAHIENGQFFYTTPKHKSLIFIILLLGRMSDL